LAENISSEESTRSGQKYSHGGEKSSLAGRRSSGTMCERISDSLAAMHSSSLVEVTVVATFMTLLLT